MGVLTRCSLYLFIYFSWLRPTKINKKDAAAIVNAKKLTKNITFYPWLVAHQTFTIYPWLVAHQTLTLGWWHTKH
ncbi:MAG: hypothetical protein EAZ15_06880 [Sphingobacteriales bacterium]|nr:MAG: hypothetical protein EAZ15_06880 [Sphingobacteriales bacterium]